MAKRLKERLKRRFPQIDFIITPQERLEFPSLINNFFFCQKLDSGPLYYSEDRIRAYLPITFGCNNRCSFCVVPYLRGSQISRAKEEIFKELNYFLEEGYKEIVLLGQNITAYKSTDGKTSKSYDFAKILKEIDKEVSLGKRRLRFLTSHPSSFYKKELFDILLSLSSLSPSFHIPLQSGSSRILKLMRRGYTYPFYKEMFYSLKNLFKGASISIITDIIVGFPTESEEDFISTYNALEELRFDAAFIFEYSRRPGTYAAEAFREEEIDREVKRDRLQKLLELQNIISKEKNKEFEGKITKVLVEGKNEKKSLPFSLWGRNPEDKIVFFNEKEDLINKEVEVKITGSATHSLWGECLSLTD
jgi:tRNA-2-methylthio-N6-dimethylallyladenosine synthase